MIRWKGRPELYIIEAEEGGSCNFPIGGHAYLQDQQIVFDGLIASPNG